MNNKVLIPSAYCATGWWDNFNMELYLRLCMIKNN